MIKRFMATSGVVLAILTAVNVGVAAQNIAPETLARHIKVLASDEFEGRKPTTPGEDKTIRYMAEQFDRVGALPGNDGGWYQNVPMVEITVDPKISLAISGAAQPLSMAYGSDMVVWTKRVQETVSVANSDVVFVGYGINAPEWGWNDYAGLDVKGKTVVVLINDPGFATRDPKLFNGRAMTYYGRWTYKFEEAARQGAAAVLIVHETEPAAYPWPVVYSSWTGPQIDMASDDNGAHRAALEGWIQLSAAETLFKAAGLDYRSLATAASKPGFKAVPLGKLQLSATLNNKIKRQESHNVVALVKGTKRPDEYILYTAHWDHLGRCPADPDGDDICNGALDNASGSAGLLAMAEAFAKNPPERSVVFLSVTGEEAGLLGSLYYSEHPIYPLAKTVAGYNMDGLNVLGRTRDIVIVGYGKSSLEEDVKRWAKAHDKVVMPETTPERGAFFRSDHFSLAKVGVPVLDANAGIDFIGKGREWGKAQIDAFIAKSYHKPSDEWSDNMDMKSAAEDVQMLYDLGYDLANSTLWPTWLPSAEFAAAREQSLKGSK